MARSNKPLIWLPFAAGGTLAAFLLPAVVLVPLLASLNILPAEKILAYERLLATLSHPLTKIILFIGLGLPLWHAAHRLRMTLQDLGVRGTQARRLIAWLCYGTAGIATFLFLYALGAIT